MKQTKTSKIRFTGIDTLECIESFDSEIPMLIFEQPGVSTPMSEAIKFVPNNGTLH